MYQQNFYLLTLVLYLHAGKQISRFITQPQWETKSDLDSSEPPKRHVVEESNIKQAWFLLENVNYVQQHGVVVDEKMMERSAQVAEEVAFLSAENEVYLSKLVENFVIDVIEHTAAKLKNLQVRLG